MGSIRIYALQIITFDLPVGVCSFSTELKYLNNGSLSRRKISRAFAGPIESTCDEPLLLHLLSKVA